MAKNLSVCSAPRSFEPAQCRKFHANEDLVKDLDVFPYLEHVEDIAHLESQPQPPPLAWTETYPGAGASLGDYIAVPRERHTQGCLEMILQNNPDFPFAKREEYKYIQCGIMEKGIKRNYDNVLREEITTLCIRSFKNWAAVHELVARMPDDQALRKWKLHTLEHMWWNDNHQCPIKYWSPDIIKSITWSMQQPSYAENLIYATECKGEYAGARQYKDIVWYTVAHGREWDQV